MPVSLCHIDTCLTSYFNGCDLPYIQVAVSGSTTLKDLSDSLKSEIRSGIISNETKEFGGIPEEELFKAVESLFEGKKLHQLFDSSLSDDDDESSESVYAYFRFDFDD